MRFIQENVPLKPFNTFHLDVNARYMAEMEDVNQIREFLASPMAGIRPVLILGGGSNILFASDFAGMILRPVIRGIDRIGEDIDHVLVKVGAGENWDFFVEWSVENSLGGIENLSLIPGTVGASPIQNIGAYGMEVKDTIHEVEAITRDNGKLIILTGGDCCFGYRDSIFKHDLRDKVIITHVTFKLDKTHHPKINYADLARELTGNSSISLQIIREAIIRIRTKKLPDPEDIGNAGSFFKNPLIPAEQYAELLKAYPDMPGFTGGSGMVKVSAAWLIDQCGWKGKRVGRTGTYERQPLILLNYGGATGREILDFGGEIQKSVSDRFSLHLEMEVNII